MYCKKCGKKLSDSARFCDRCGQPSGTAPKKTQRPAAPQNRTQTLSKRQQDSYDRYRKKQLQKEAEKKRRRKRTRIITIWVILIALLGSVGGGLYAYYYTMKNSGGDWTGANASASPADTQQSSPLPSASSETAQAAASATASAAQDNSGCEIYIDNAYGFKCPYPAKFETGTLSNRNTRLSLKDPDGDGEMLISYEKISETQTAANLMRDYVKGIGVSADFNRAGENWYEVDFTRNGKVNHRKAVIIEKNKYVYFDFTYNENTEHKKVYDSYIDYADEYLDNQYTEKAKEDAAEKSDD
ncbi:MAG: zinc ribbon domain-containing protein [Clostridia bacterium]|nr:zinc ribbon domain-containing protein [Clostridia bacterium]